MRSVEEIYGQMMDCFVGLTGFEMRDDCDLAVRLYAAAAQIQGLYTQCDWTLRQCFPQTAQGEYLDYHAQTRALERKQAVRAMGALRFYAAFAGETVRLIPAGTVAMTEGLVRFETTQEGRLPAGAEYVDVPAQAVEAGAAGNVAVEAVTALAAIPSGIGRCTNPVSFKNGSDGESDDALRVRVLESFRRLPNGANAAFYEQGARSFDAVCAATVIPRSRGIGTVDVVVATQAGLPGQELLQEIWEYFQSRREIAVDVRVIAPQVQNVNVRVKLEVKQGAVFADVKQRVQKAIGDWFSGERLGKPVRLAQLGNLVYGCEGVENYSFAEPTKDSVGAANILPVLGTLTVEALA